MNLEAAINLCDVLKASGLESINFYFVIPDDKKDVWKYPQSMKFINNDEAKQSKINELTDIIIKNKLNKMLKQHIIVLPTEDKFKKVKFVD